MDGSGLGFAHFLAQADVVSKTLLAILILMSLASWSVIFLKVLQVCCAKFQNRRFLTQFETLETVEVLDRQLEKNHLGSAFALLARKGIAARKYYEKITAGHKEEGAELDEFLIRTLRATLDEIQLRKENGLSILATVASTAPFVGLFGTVWGIYHALISISASGAGTIDKVAGPVGEALIMTGIGLAVAIPAVMAYNWASRSNRVAMGQLDTFAFDLLTFLKSGSLLPLQK